jgi:arylsulfatase A-like enzyme
MMDKALPFIENAAKEDTPFFVVIWFHAPHGPVVGGPEFLKMYEEYDKEARHYYACVTALDLQVGRLRKALRESRVADNTMLFFCSDNGPEGQAQRGRYRGSAGPFRGRKRALFEGGIRVPGLLEWPKNIKPNSVTDYPAVTSDYLPTILDVLGVKLPDARPLDGLSLMPVIDGNRAQRPAPIGFETTDGGGSATPRATPKTALIDNRYKLLSDMDPKGKRDMLFDLIKDPGEKHNLAKEKPEVVAKMKATLKAWRNGCRHSDAGGDY